MSLTVTFCRGIPGSGKSYRARELAQQTGALILELDQLRAMLGQPWSQEHENFVQKQQDDLGLAALRSGRSVIFANTNLPIKNPRRFATLVWECGFDVEYRIEDFVDVPLATCALQNELTHDRKPVPVDVLDKMHKILERERSKGLWTVEDLTRDLPKIEPYVPDVTKPPAILVDCDGTLANATTRGPYDFDRCGEDELWQHVKEFVNAWGWWKSEDDGNPFVIVMSGRDSKYRNITRRWLDKHDIVYDLLLMRPEGDTSRDSLTKLRLFNESVRNEYNVIAAWDDRRRVQRLWHQMGIPVVGCGGPDDDF